MCCRRRELTKLLRVSIELRARVRALVSGYMKASTAPEAGGLSVPGEDWRMPSSRWSPESPVISGAAPCRPVHVRLAKLWSTDAMSRSLPWRQPRDRAGDPLSAFITPRPGDLRNPCDCSESSSSARAVYKDSPWSEVWMTTCFRHPCVIEASKSRPICRQGM